MYKKLTKDDYARRLLWPVTVTHQGQLFDLPMDHALRNAVQTWIEKHTTGRYYIGITTIYFCEGKDALVYKLCDVTRKCQEELTQTKQLR